MEYFCRWLSMRTQLAIDHKKRENAARIYRYEFAKPKLFDRAISYKGHSALKAVISSLVKSALLTNDPPSSRALAFEITSIYQRDAEIYNDACEIHDKKRKIVSA